MSKVQFEILSDRRIVLLFILSFVFGLTAFVAGTFFVSLNWRLSSVTVPVLIGFAVICAVGAVNIAVVYSIRRFLRVSMRQVRDSIATEAEEKIVQRVSSALHGNKNDILRLQENFQQLTARIDKDLSRREEVLHQLLRMAVQVGSCVDIFTRDELKIMSKRFDQYDDLTTYWLLSTYDAFDVLSLSARRKLANGLRSIGYLEKSLHVFEGVVALTKSESDRDALARRRNELEVFRGRYEPKLGHAHETLEPDRNHVLHVVGKALPGVQTGYTLRTHYTALAQRDAGLRVSVVSQSGEPPLTSVQALEIIDGISYYTIPGNRRNTVILEQWLDENIAGLVSLVREIRPSVLHAHSDFFNAISAQAVGDFFGIPVVYESRGFWEESWLSRVEQRFGMNWVDVEARWGLPEAYVLRKEREEEARSRARMVFTLARVMKKRISEDGVRGDRIALVPNAVSAVEFPILGRDKSLTDELGVDGCVTIGYISSIVEYEGIGTLIEAFRVLSDSVNLPLKLIIVGDGPVLPELVKQAADSGMTEVVFVGRVPHADVLRYYSVIDIFVVPRRPAAVCQLVTPLKPFEAFSTGRTVVMSDVEALREIAEDSGAAELFRAGDAENLAKVLTGLVNDPERRQALAQRGAEWVRSQRSWNSNAGEYLKVYEQLGLRI
ncbi:glycosyltransferase [Arthrobacter sp. Helios]|uniref:glycosyltransferase n=1 Tax=Arthrobacter sp. Helios TaxID=2828862 RepID=UPI002070ADF7|nr:glycosyltransferase [Arthrobacter sp. Helios]UPO78672.1 glycosyltransferase [Arthrobacter sp. Helios]